MRLATWNINGMKARLDYARHFVREVAPDVVGLQELKMTDEQFPHDAFRELGYSAFTHGKKGWNGVAVLCRGDATVEQVGLPGQEAAGARLLTVNWRDISFTTIYCPNGKSVDHGDFEKKLGWLDALLAHLSASHEPSRPAVLCGDFNVVPAPLDSWNEAGLGGEIFHTEAERQRIARLRSWGWVDTYRARHPDEPGFTWWDYRGGAFHKQQGLRIDLLWATPPVADRVREASVDRKWRKKIEGLIASDHAPLWVDLG
jgi:exodeoxyribonuclease-3